MWGIQKILQTLRQIFIHQYLPDDPNPEHIMWWIDQIADYDKYHKGMDGAIEPFYRPTAIRFLGPNMRNDGWNANRITIYYGPDRKITSISIG